jgi:hypothetical protein
MDILNSANSQSALIATVQSVEDSAVDPWSYSLSRYTPAHAKGWTRLGAVNPQQAQFGGSVYFDVPKLGWLTDMCFSCNVEFPAGDGIPALSLDNCLGLPSTGWLNIFDSVVVQSSSRELYRMTRAAMLCAFSDLDVAQRMAIQKALSMKSDPLYSPEGRPSNATDGKMRILLPLLLACTGKSDLNIPALFSEPVRVVINFAPNYAWLAQFIATPAAGFVVGGGAWASPSKGVGDAIIPLTFTDPELIMQQVSLPAELTASTLQQNYSSGSLTQLSYNYVEEVVRATATLPNDASAGSTYSHVLTSTNCVHDIYVYVSIPASSAEANILNPTDDCRDVASALETPIPLSNISFSASGQNIVENIDAQFMGLFSRPTTGDGFYQTCGGGGFLGRYPNQARAPTDESGFRDVMNSCYVYRITFSESASKLFSGNMVNLRELSQPTISVQLPRVATAAGVATTYANDQVPNWAQGATVQMHVVLRTAGLISTDSANGRTVAVLSN